jgi:dihydrofolate reductase
MKLIACIDKNFNIGKDNKLLFHIPEDMTYFKKTTMNKIVVMGRKTYESIGSKPLANRLNIVITNQFNEMQQAMIKYQPEANQSVIFMSMMEFLNGYLPTVTRETYDNIFVIGGAQIYNYLLPICDTLLLTRVGTVINDADTRIENLSYENHYRSEEDDKYYDDMYILYNSKDDARRYELSLGIFNMWSDIEKVHYDFLTYKLKK